MKPIRIVAKDPEIDITVPMGDGPAYPTGGLGGYEVVDRQDDVGMTDWSGQTPLTEEVPLLLNGYERDDSVEREWNTIKKLGRDPNGERKPPVFRVWGPLDAPEGKAWVLPDNGIEVNSDSILKRNGDGTLLRIEFTLHLLEYIRPDVVGRPRKKLRAGISRHTALTYTTQAGDTLAVIAARLFGDWRRWKEIGEKNGISDPNRRLPAGKVLAL